MITEVRTLWHAPELASVSLWQAHWPDALTLSTLAMTDDELVRAARMPELRRRCFVACRVLLRQCLSRIVGWQSDGLRFGYNAFGKPELVMPKGEFSFSMSHSGQWLVIAVARQSLAAITLGVDVKIDTLDARRRAAVALEFLGIRHTSGRSTVAWSAHEARAKAVGRSVFSDSDDLAQSHVVETVDAPTRCVTSVAIRSTAPHPYTFKLQ